MQKGPTFVLEQLFFNFSVEHQIRFTNPPQVEPLTFDAVKVYMRGIKDRIERCSFPDYNYSSGVESATISPKIPCRIILSYLISLSLLVTNLSLSEN